MTVKKLIQPTLLFLFLELAWNPPSQAMPKKESPTNTGCNRLGRVVWAQGYSVRPSQIICEGMSLQNTASAKLKLFCYKTLTKIIINGTTDVAQKCPPIFTQQQNNCEGTQNFAACSRGSTSQTALIRPFGKIILEGRPTLEWRFVKHATHYKVALSGFDLAWEKTVSGNRIGYPSDQPSLAYAGNYKLTLYAYRQNKLLTTQQASLSLLPEQEVKQIVEGVQIFNQIPLSQAERGKDLDYIYRSRNLLNKSIETLENLSNSPHGTTEIRKLLAERLREAGHPELTASKSSKPSINHRPK